MADAALVVIAVDLTVLSAVALVFAYRVARASEALERAAVRLERAFETMDEVGEQTRRVVGDVRNVSRELSTVVDVVGVSKRTRATLVGAKAAMAAFKRHSNGSS